MLWPKFAGFLYQICGLEEFFNFELSFRFLLHQDFCSDLGGKLEFSWAIRTEQCAFETEIGNFLDWVSWKTQKLSFLEGIFCNWFQILASGTVRYGESNALIGKILRWLFDILIHRQKSSFRAVCLEKDPIWIHQKQTEFWSKKCFSWLQPFSVPKSEDKSPHTHIQKKEQECRSLFLYREKERKWGTQAWAEDLTCILISGWKKRSR